MDKVNETDILVIGCGIAGSIAALELADAGFHVTVLSSGEIAEETSTMYAQGGIIYRGSEDSPELLAEDIMRAGAGLCNPSAIKVLVDEGPALVRDLLFTKYEVPFDKGTNEDVSLVREGGHSLERIVHVADTTGRAIQIALLKALRSNKRIVLREQSTAVDLLTPSHHSMNRLAVYDPLSCVGAYVLDHKTGVVATVLARKTILATGGLGQIFLRTTNPAIARGDGLAIAHRSGARVLNCEFVQFHPTAFFHPHHPPFLISEAVRGAGARLVNTDGDPFMQRYDPEWKDLAPRDIVSRSIHQEMLQRGVPNVYLDLTNYIDRRKIEEHFPGVLMKCLEFGIDIRKDLVPVVPAAHYFIGGVWVDEWGRTTVKDLYAIGEVACTGVHGANRLASTSLLEGLVWGVRTARSIGETRKERSAFDPSSIPEWRDTGSFAPDPALITQDMSVIKNIMWNYVGLARTDYRLQRALRELRHLELEIERFYRKVRLTDQLVGLRNMARTALLVTQAAWENKKSIGCHFRQ